MLIHRLTRSKKITVYVLAFLFLPGTIIHELAHFLMAKILFVPASHIRLLPELDGREVRLGSVSVGKTDPIRRFLIGAAPFFFGTLIVLTTIIVSIQSQVLNNYWYLALAGYTVFEIGNTMFSSKKDMEGAIELFIGLFLIIAILIFFRIRIETLLIAVLQTKSLASTFQTGTLLLAAPIALDIVIITLIKSLHRLSK